MANRREIIFFCFPGSCFLRIRPDNDGANVKATKVENTTDIARVRANSLNIRPVIPPENPTGRNTVIKTMVVAMTANTTSPTPNIAASIGVLPFC